MENRVSRLEERMDKIEVKVDQHAIEQAETRVYVKQIHKTMGEIKDSISSITTRKEEKTDKDTDRWAKIVERSIWAIVAIVAYLSGNGGIG